MEIPYTLTARPDTGLYNGKLGIWLFLASEVMLFGALFTSYLFVRLGAEDGTWPSHVLSVPLGLFNTAMLIISSITMVYAWVALKERNLNKFRMFLAATILCAVVFLCIKSKEYYDKYEHWGFMIKAEAMDKYLPELQKMDAQVTSIPSQQVFEITGDREWSKEKDGNFVLIPIKTFHPFGYKAPETPGVEKTGGEAAEETVTIDKNDVERKGNFLPAYGTYFAIYFTVTGLHALHIIGGIVVMCYFLGPGSALYRRNPEQLTNRIEVTGIFWHFVDLVWITVFPILYLT
jgi:cytochrome c oxidase subunit 3